MKPFCLSLRSSRWGERPREPLQRFCALILLLICCSSGYAQHYYDQQLDPQLLRLSIRNTYDPFAEPVPGAWQLYEYLPVTSIGCYAEGWREQVHYQSGFSSVYDHLFIGPYIAGGLRGSFYHPNLFQFDLSGDFSPGYAWDHYTVSGGGIASHSQQETLYNYSANAIVLDNKPYRVNMFANSSHSFRAYDFFNEVLVDSQRYGLTSGYNQGPVPVSVTFTHLDETTSGTDFNTSLRQTTVNLDAHNDRHWGRTLLTYNFNDFARNVDFENSSGIENSFGISDSETFGSRKNIEWRNNLGYAVRDFTLSPGDSLVGGSHLIFEHWTNLWSYYDGNYLRDRNDETVTENYDGSVALRHQLFSSLTSGLRAQAIHYDSQQPGSDFESTQYLFTWTESYTKKLSESARLTVGGSLGFSHMNQKSTSAVQISGEAHNFSSGGPVANSFFLNLPNVDQSTIQIFDSGRTIRYTRGLDYSVTTIGGRTLIELIQPNPSGLTSTTPLLVDYQAAPQGSGTVKGQFNDAEIRLDLLDGRLGFYARYNEADYTAPASIIVQDVTSFAFGADYTWRWLRVGAEYDIYDSTFASYNSARLYQTLTFNPDEVSTLSANLSEEFADYRTGGRTEQYYSGIARYHRGLTAHFGMDLEAGVSERTGDIVNEFLAAVRPGITYTIGKLTMKTGYDFEYQDTQNNQERTRHRFFFRLQRSF